MDRDGDADAAACALDGTISWWANPAGAGAWTETPVGALAGCRALELGDPDRDGDLDLLATSGVGTASWWDNEGGDGAAWSERALTTADDHNDVLAADLDGDGDRDLVGADLSAAQLTLFENASSARSGELGLRNWFFYGVPTGGDLSDLAHADLDGDGLLDIVWVEQDFLQPPSTSVVDWMSGVGAEPTVGVLQFATEFDIYHDTNAFPHSVATGDVDDDGDVDVLVGIEDDIAGNPVLCANSGAVPPAWSCTSLGSGTFATVEHPELADLDGDGDLDFAAQFIDAATIHSLRWWEQVGDPTTSGGWADHAIHAGPIDIGFRLEVADLDRDGDLDLVHNTDYGPGTGATWWRNDGGSPLVWTAQTIPDVDTGVFGLRAWDLGDIDEDGDLDVASRFAWMENQLPTGWVEHEFFPPGGPEHPAGSSALADLDADGDPDFITYFEHHAPPSDRLSWFENDVGVDPLVWEEHAIEPLLGITDPQLADFDRDGDPDLVVFDAVDVNSWVNAGGQFHLEATSVAPATIAEEVERALL
ncbi:MAG: VCBS repeat-containing protein, partial [Chloroflexi bacterium]|nr:VCBS repeat-containing protein [Chloroflexota bacterium]